MDTKDLDAKIEQAKTHLASTQDDVDNDPYIVQQKAIAAKLNTVRDAALALSDLENKKQAILDAQARIDDANKTIAEATQIIEDLKKSIG